ncbi:single-stranded-DNA-specific exonuclease RecJ [Hymenobacter lapidiphilus]|uniref:Single-stranded-DNA-specific exonuclease RecJ n=1 Tax=Hymenobacter lapidiphilus TaxID=2608003 RepID=A0A7Y7PPA8_9BACT|nr:single-stranded-DNA-specific exonuclease RecJ [Hymenobacter lapidiphilus]NVO31521.1 single-stranded-DNA-specific exonuclease RecJ [Hymenobacter lapidiphilus]
MLQKRWIRKPAPEAAQVAHLTEALRVNEAIVRLLCQREIGTFELARSYFRPDLGQLHDPLLMRDMDRAVARLVQALHGGERVLVYGDYDVDGTTSVALVYSYLLRFFGPGRIEYYIPDRYKEGYGVSEAGIDHAQAEGFQLIIALDCGVKSVDKVAYANERGIDFIICDHHLPGAELPDAVAVLDPKRADCAYPFKELCGCGVGFKLLQAFTEHQGLPEDNLYELLDLVAVAIAADIVPIYGENRTLAFHGLRLLNDRARTQRPGFEALRELAGLGDTELNITSLVFGFSPRINAAGRMGDAKRAVAMLLADSADQAKEKAGIVDKTNQERRSVDTSTAKEALAMIEEDAALQAASSTVLFKPDWHKGVVGIVASRCIDKYYRPTVILTESNGKATGSARSVVGFDVHQAIEECAELLDQFGGHMYAAGLTLPLENVALFQQKFERIVAGRITPEQLIPPVDIDCTVALSDITPSFYKLLSQMEPFGPGNANPVFASENVTAAPDSARIVGNSHLKIALTQNGGRNRLEAIGFGMGDHLERIQQGEPFSVCYNVEINEYRGVKSLQLKLKDIRWESDLVPEVAGSREGV